MKALNITAIFSHHNHSPLHTSSLYCLSVCSNNSILFLSVKIYKTNSRMSLRAAGIWILNPHNELSVWGLLTSLKTNTACVCAYVSVTDLGYWRETYV